MTSSAPDLDPLVGSVLGGCRIERLLGRGGMGAVYLATQLDLERRVALKVLPSDLATNQSYLMRFEREARTIAQVSHSNIVQVFFTGRDGQRRFLVMEFVEGMSLAAILRARSRLPVDEAVDAVHQSARALTAAWARSIVHRDIKPENILVTADGQVKVADFGLAKNTDDATGHTQSGALLGTAHYMSPEQAKGQAADIRADVYALGITFWECLAGRRPFEGHTPVAVLYKHMYEPLPDVRTLAPETPEEISQLIAKMAHKIPEQRHAAPAEVVAALDAYEAKSGRRGRITLPASTATTRLDPGTATLTPRRPEAETPTMRRAAPTTEAEVLQAAGAEAEWNDARAQALALEEQGRAAEGAALVDAFLGRPHQGGLRRVEAAALAQSLRTDDFSRVDAHLQALSFPDVTHDSLWQMGLRAYRDGEFAEALDTWCELAGHTDRRGEVLDCAKAAFIALTRAIGKRAAAGPRAAHRELAAVCERASRTLAGWPRLSATREWAVYADIPDQGRTLFDEARRLETAGDPAALEKYREAHAQFLANPAWELRARGAIASMVRRLVDAAVRETAAVTATRSWETAAESVWRVWSAVRRGLLHEPNNVVLVRMRKKVESSAGFALVREWQEALDGVASMTSDAERVMKLLALRAKYAGTPLDADLAADLAAADVRLWTSIDAIPDPAKWIEAFEGYRAAWPASPRIAAAAERERSMKYLRALRLAEGRLLEGDGKGARQAAEEALALKPGDAAAEELRAQAEKLWSRYDEVIAEAERHVTTRAWKPAIAAATQALSYRPGDSKATSMLAAVRNQYGHDLASFEVLRTLAGHAKGVAGVGFSGDGKTVVSAGADGALRLWDAATGAELVAAPAHRGPVAALAVARGFAATAEGTVKIWDLAAKALKRELTPPRVMALAFSPDGAALATASDDKSIRVWDPATGKQTGTLAAPLMGATGIAFSADGRSVATAGVGATVCTVGTQKSVSLPKQVGSFVKVVAFSPDGTLLLAGRAGIWICAAGTWQGLRQLETSAERVRAAAFAPDAGAVAVASEDAVITIYNPRAGGRIQMLRGGAGAVTSIAFASDGLTLASGHADGSIRLWGVKMPA
jgi:WD40 repeat protein/predicted Ser/Thr protein kinase